MTGIWLGQVICEHCYLVHRDRVGGCRRCGWLCGRYHYH